MRKLFLRLVVGLGAVGCFAAAPGASGVNVVDVMQQMAEKRGRFDPRELLTAGAQGAGTLMDRLLPDTRVPPGAKPSPFELDNLIKQLDSAPFPAKQALTARLVEAGQPAWLKLKSVAESAKESPQRRSAAAAVMESWRSGKWNEVSRYSDAFRTYAGAVRDPACLTLLARRAKLALDCGMPEFGRRDVICGALRAVGKFGDVKCLEILAPLVDHEDPEVAVMVLETIGTERDGQALPEWFERAARSQRASVATAALEWMGRSPRPAPASQPAERAQKAGASPASKPVRTGESPGITALIERAADYEDEGCRDAAGHLASECNHGVSSELIQRLIPLLKSPEPFVRSRIGGAVAFWGNEAGVRAVIPLLADVNASVADDVARELANRSDLAQLDRLLAEAVGAKDQDADVSAAAETFRTYVRQVIEATRPLATQPATSPAQAQIRMRAARESVARPRMPGPATRPWWDGSPAYFKRSQFVADPAPAEMQALLQPSRVTIHVKDAEAREVFETIGKQAGVRFDPITPTYWQRTRPRITLDANDQPLWSVLLDLKEKASVALRPHNRESIWLVMGNPEMSGRALVQGPFLIYSIQKPADWSATHARPVQGLQDLRVMMTLLSEPKTSIVGCAGLVLDEVVDDEGRSLLAKDVAGAPVPDDRREIYATAGQDHFPFEAQFWRQLGPDGKGLGARLKRVRGRLRVIVAMRTQVVDVPEIAPANGHRYAVAGTRLLFGEMNPSKEFSGPYTGNRLLPFSVERVRPAAEEWVSKQRFLGSFRFELFDDFGDELQTQGRNWPPLTIPGAQYVFGAKPKEMVLCGRPTRLRVEAPTAVRAVEVPFEFTDMELPTPRNGVRQAR
jgi:HEAT repeat protein